MENLSIAIRALFGHVDGNEILEHLEKNVRWDTDMTESTMVQSLLSVDKSNTIDQMSMLQQLITSKWMNRDVACRMLQYCPSSTIFNILLYFSKKCLTIQDGEPLCKYSQLLRWHSLSTHVSEDLLTTAFLAARDLKIGYGRNSFDWDAFLQHDATEVNALFSKEMSELHMHLKGSSLNFEIAWLCLMTHVEEMQDRFSVEHMAKRFTKQDPDLYNKVRCAAAIRLYLAGACDCHKSVLTEAELHDLLYGVSEERKKELEEAGVNVEEIQKDLTKLLNGETENTLRETQEQYNLLKDEQHFDDDLRDDDIIDYIKVLHYGNEPIENKIMASERRFMYSVLKTIYKNDAGKQNIATLFYAYLAYKHQVRNEILQNNERTGFANFANYEEGKQDFILDQYEPLLYKGAICGFLGNRTDRYVEARIVPKNSQEGIIASLKKITDAIPQSLYNQYDIIFHFIKKRDDRKPDSTNYRHQELLEEIKKQAFAIYDFRCNHDNWSGKDSLVGKVVGIDAANSEIFCRPEVYAQAFRFLRNHEIHTAANDTTRPYDLRVTYHVGEDFLDVADGLRAVEEAMRFLDLRNGDRIGHAFVLGIDVRNYYSKRYNTVCATKQVLLDNFAWLHHKCVRLIGYTPLCGYLEMMFQRYFQELYIQYKEGKVEDLYKEIDDDNEEEEIISNTIEDYYLSWALRGNAPDFATQWKKGTENPGEDTRERQWRAAALCHHRGSEMALQNAKARELFDRYQSHNFIKKTEDTDSFTIPPVFREEWLHLLETIQEDLLDRIERRHIAIECNPTSNYKIGDMDSYDQHPILRFFNYGLDTPYPQHNISVSINTDDQGIFSTSLEREYSLMALAMERRLTADNKNTPRMIVEWLDKIREMANEQRFKNKYINSNK